MVEKLTIKANIPFGVFIIKLTINKIEIENILKIN